MSNHLSGTWYAALVHVAVDGVGVDIVLMLLMLVAVVVVVDDVLRRADAVVVGGGGDVVVVFIFVVDAGVAVFCLCFFSVDVIVLPLLLMCRWLSLFLFF